MSAHRSRYADCNPFTTKDGSTVRELMHPAQSACREQSLAEAILSPGTSTLLHRHRRSEELYHVTAGRGMMTLGETVFAIEAGDTMCIPPGTAHCIANTGDSN